MCLILLAWRRHARFPLVVAANRDEYHARDASRASFWADAPGILAGRDLKASGTWLGVARRGKFAAVTNFRGGTDPNAAESRGHLVSRFLANGATPAGYISEIATHRAGYSGFNLLVADDAELWWISNRDSEPRRLEPGIYGLGNDLLDSAEPAVQEGKERLANVLAAHPSVESLLSILAPAKIVAPDYGTRCSTVLTKDANGTVAFAERAFDVQGGEADTLRFEFVAGR